jgi:hypothetical protein
MWTMPATIVGEFTAPARMGLSRGVPRRDIVASSHGPRCEYGSCDQRGRHEGHFGHLFLHVVTEAKEGSLL